MVCLHYLQQYTPSRTHAAAHFLPPPRGLASEGCCITATPGHHPLHVGTGDAPALRQKLCYEAPYTCGFCTASARFGGWFVPRWQGADQPTTNRFNRQPEFLNTGLHTVPLGIKLVFASAAWLHTAAPSAWTRL